MIQGKLLYYGDDLKEVYDIRKKVFVEELGVPMEKEFDELDKEAVHVLVFEQTNQENSSKQIPVAAGRIIWLENVCEIGHVAVLKEYRHREYGDFTVRMLINKAFHMGIDEVIAKIRPEFTNFIKKIGFMPIYSVTSMEDQVCMKINVKDMKTPCNK